METTLLEYLRRFKKEKLRPDKSHKGIALHKPILLLTVLKSFKNHTITENRIDITPELVALFQSLWSLLVETSHDCRISYPFYYLKSQKFWHLVAKPGYENIEALGSAMKSFNKLHAAIEYAYLDENLYELMRDEHCNLILTRFLLDEYFPNTKDRFDAAENVELTLFKTIETKILKESSVEYASEIKNLILQKNEEEIFLRSGVFKREIPKIYENACCISGMRISAISNVSMIDACHIVPFSKSYDDTISNGIALCPNLHRAFDRGLISLDDDYRVVVSETFSEVENDYGIRKFSGRQISLPHEQKFRPLQENLAWHRQNVFKTF